MTVKEHYAVAGLPTSRGDPKYKNWRPEVDIVLCPPISSLAFPHDHTPEGSRQLDIDGSKIPYNDLIAWAGIATLNGPPATTMPNGRSENGLPIGVQIIGGYLEDRSTICFAGLIEREFGGFTPPPT